MKLSSLIDAVYTTDEVVITKWLSCCCAGQSDEFEGWKETVAIRSDAASWMRSKRPDCF
jgi:hypothetical protein